MNWWQGFVLGLVQGLTEFLPVSSSGHLAIGKQLLGIEVVDDPVFEVVVHFATVLSTIIVFRAFIWDLLKGLFRFKMNDQTDYILKICVSMIPVFIVGVFFKDFVTGLFANINIVGGALIVTAILLFFSDNFAKFFPSVAEKQSKNEHRNGISYLQAFIVGLGQALAVVPGLSRSGTTISTGLMCGVKRENVAQFSFLMVLVPILGEMFLDVVGGDVVSSGTAPVALVCGFVAAFLSGLFACRVMISIVKKARLIWFAIYCLIAGSLTLILPSIL